MNLRPALQNKAVHQKQGAQAGQTTLIVALFFSQTKQMSFVFILSADIFRLKHCKFPELTVLHESSLQNLFGKSEPPIVEEVHDKEKPTRGAHFSH